MKFSLYLSLSNSFCWFFSYTLKMENCSSMSSRKTFFKIFPITEKLQLENIDSWILSGCWFIRGSKQKRCSLCRRATTFWSLGRQVLDSQLRPVTSILQDCESSNFKVAVVCSSGIACTVYGSGMASTVHVTISERQICQLNWFWGGQWSLPALCEGFITWM